MKRIFALLAAGALAVLLPTVSASSASAAPPNSVVRKVVALGSDGCMTSSGTSVDLRSCVSGTTPASQRWYVYTTKRDGRLLYKVRSQTSGGLCLDSNDAGRVYLHACNDGSYQIWQSVTGANFKESRKPVLLRNYQTGRYLTWRNNWASPDTLLTQPRTSSEFYGEASVVR